MGKWLELAARLEADAGDNRDNRDDSPGFVANVPNVPNVPAFPPPSVTEGLEQLRKMAAPHISEPMCWPRVVSDALMLARDGWAAKALALGWTDLDLFGAVPNADGDPAGDGLAVWLNGRELSAMTADYAVAAHPGGRAYFNRREASGAVLLWALGRGR
jgi:hypothetical protein